MNKQNYIIRTAEKKDLEAIREIYNEAVLNSTSTFDIEPRTKKQQVEWFRQHKGIYSVIVYEINGEVKGWAALSKWSNRPAYKDTAENSVYVKKEFRNQGIGKALLNQLIKNAGQVGLHTIIARIASENEISIKIHKDFGFEIMGVMKEAGKKFGKYIDVTFMQKML